MPRRKPGAEPKRKGRKPEITEAQKVSLETLLGNHNSIRTACVLTGIPVGTYHQWCARAEEPGSNPVYAAFRDRMIRARELGKANLIKGIADAGKTDWRALLALGERMYRDDLAPPDRMEVKHTGAIQHDHKAIILNIPAAIAQPRLLRQIEARKDPEPETP